MPPKLDKVSVVDKITGKTTVAVGIKTKDPLKIVSGSNQTIKATQSLIKNEHPKN